MYNKNNLILIAFIIFFIFDIFLWLNILFFKYYNFDFYFLDVGQGDSSLINFKNKVLILVDAGPNDKVVFSLDKIFRQKRNYIDLGIITHPQLDHFGGFFSLLDRYDFGAFIINGRVADEKTKDLYINLIKKIESKNIPIITLFAGDKILYEKNLIYVLSPDKNWIQSAELNDTALVLYVKNNDFNTLLTSDIGFSLEKYLLNKYSNFQANILKIAHHGSKYSTDKEFLLNVHPNLALIGVGKNNFGHPSNEVLKILQNFNIPVFRTDLNGNILISFKDNNLVVKTDK